MGSHTGGGGGGGVCVCYRVVRSGREGEGEIERLRGKVLCPAPQPLSVDIANPHWPSRRRAISTGERARLTQWRRESMEQNTGFAQNVLVVVVVVVVLLSPLSNDFSVPL